MALTLRKSFGFALIGNLTYAASQYLILLTFVKLFSNDDVGMFIYAGAFTAPLMLALEMQLRNFLITESKEGVSFSDFQSFRVLTNVVALIGLLSFAYIYKTNFFPIIFIVVFIKIFESQLDLIYGVYQKQNRLDIVAYSKILRGVVACSTVIVTSMLFKSILISLFSYLFIWVFIYFFHERRRVVKDSFLKKNELKFCLPSSENFIYILSICSPMFLAIFVDKYYLNYPRLLVEEKLGVDALAIFGSLLYFKTIGSQFITSMAQSAIPRLTTYVINNNFIHFNRLVFKMVIYGFLVGGGLTLFFYFFGDFVIELVYKKEYVTHKLVLVYLLIGSTISFSYIFICSSLTCLRKQWVKLPVSIISLLIIFIQVQLTDKFSMLSIAKLVIYTESVIFCIYFLIHFYFQHSNKKKSQYV